MHLHIKKNYEVMLERSAIFASLISLNVYVVVIITPAWKLSKVVTFVVDIVFIISRALEGVLISLRSNDRLRRTIRAQVVDRGHFNKLPLLLIVIT